jgi:3-oxoacyl-[acyl-carrier protein] reductase
VKNSKVILVSGGSRGLGEAVLKHLLEKTAHRVVTFSRSETPATAAFRKKYKNRFFYRQADLSSSREMTEFAAWFEKMFKGIDVLINNAGIAREGVLPVFPEQEIDRVMSINLTGTIKLTRLMTRLMIKRKEGVIINISSIIGLRGYAGLSVYSASKAGLIGFTQSLARELGRRNIRVNAIAPGYLETEMSGTLTQGQREQIIRRTPLGRLGTAQDVLPLIDLLISPEAEFITGQTFTVDGGITC